MSIRGIVLSIFFCVSIVLNAREYLPEDGKAEFFSTFRKQVENVKTLKTDFVQERHMSAFSETLKTDGRCSFEYPSRLRWEILEPYKSILVYEDGKIGKFDFEDGSFRRMNLGNYDMLTDVLTQIISWMHGDFSKTENVYLCNVKKENRNYLIVLEPRSAKMKKYLQSIELSVRDSDYHVDKVVIRESPSDYIEIKFEKEKINTVFPQGFFNTEKPFYGSNEGANK